jgi:hypothetical protein
MSSPSVDRQDDGGAPGGADAQGAPAPAGQTPGDRVAQLVATLTADDDMYEFRRLLSASVSRA